MDNPIYESLNNLLSDNAEIVNDLKVNILLLGRSYISTLQKLFDPWEAQFLQPSVSIPDIFRSPVQLDLVLLLDRDIRRALNPFELLSEDGAPTAAEKRSLNALCIDIFESKSPFVVYTLNPVSHCLVQGTSNTWDDDVCAQILTSLPTVIEADMIRSDLTELPVSFYILKSETNASPIIPVPPVAARVQKPSSTQDLDASFIDMSMSDNSSFDDKLLNSSVFNNIAQSLAFLVSAQQAQVAPAPRPLLNSSGAQRSIFCIRAWRLFFRRMQRNSNVIRSVILQVCMTMTVIPSYTAMVVHPTY
jgi:hypothetical protein